MKAVIPAAGLGTRFLPATKSAPKEMLPLLDRPAIQYVVEEAIEAGCDDILIVTGRTKRAIEDHFDLNVELEHFSNGHAEELRSVQDIASLADIHFIRQKEPHGLGDAVYHAKKHIGSEPFLVLLGDDITFSQPRCARQLVEQHQATDGMIVAVERIRKEQTSAYGVVAVGGNADDRVRPVHDLVEKPGPQRAPSDLGIIGRYVLGPEIFEAIARTRPGKNGEVQLTDALRLVGTRVPLHAYRYNGIRFDLGNKMEWLKTNIAVALMRDDYREPLLAYLRTIVPPPTMEVMP